MASETDRKTPIYDAHIQAGARMVSFAGYSMPLQYTGIVDEHRSVRTEAGLFDVSHMGRINVAGDQAEAFLQWVSTNDVSRLAVGHAQYSMVCQESGGILDDVFIYKTGEAAFRVRVNPSNPLKIT